MMDIIAKDDRPMSGKPCGRCSRLTGEWKLEHFSFGSAWTVTCDNCGNGMLTARLVSGGDLERAASAALKAIKERGE